ncbi:sensor histidine kinase/response regulator [Aspergillus uvarum CBS 121591]|uniref:Sensor histidine kinase/response regulator n=1 Tax=Aspergillus uvarum CBS 121591 TaxID=1448315 RepID=A0A319CN99_9EURO|nr:sensor histidine kinase/response regulator [Aspergillus uvarum CBS 121591]PYH85561.1 sensor histidine kinase/response regulator [Aspergillus uvarum CBS 121591]
MVASMDPSSVASQHVDDDPRTDLAVTTHEGSSGSSPENSDLSRDTSVGGSDRVYPIRSIVSVNPFPISPSQAVAATSSTQSRSGARSYSIIDSDTWDQIRSQPVLTPPSDAAASSSEPQYTPATSEDASQQPSEGHSRNSDAGIRVPVDSNGALLPVDKNKTHVTSRFQHVMIQGGHAVITGNTPDTFMACEDEPIHIPGAVQSFGVLLAMREDEDGILSVRVASENSEAILDHSPSSLFALESFCDLLSEDQADILLDHVDFVRDEGHDPSADGPEVFILTVNDRTGRPRRFWCAIHVIPTQREIIICEFELEDDRLNPLNMGGRTTPLTQSDTLGFDPTPEQLASSTVNISQPLRVLRNARRRRGEAAAMEVFSIVSQIQDQLGDAKTLDTLLNITVGLVKELTGFHRVMIYQFDSEYNGTVVAELVDPRTTKDLYKGLHFPAADIPRQARDLYRINKVRLLYDRDQLTSRLVCRSSQDLETPLDLTHAHLRAMSPIHIRYLANMGVRSSMSISINSPNDLWGLISCHTHGDAAMRVPFPIRKMCRLIGDTLSRNIERLSFTSRLQARKLINTIPTDANPSGYIIASSDDMLKLFDADYGAISIRGETKILGKSTESHEMLALLEFLKMRRLHSVVASHHVTKDFPDLHYPPGFKHISGILYVPLSSDGKDFIVFFRKGQLTEIKWGGNPHEKEFKDGHLEPRKSFQVWSETVIDQSREWSESEVETAAVLCLVYGKFIKVWRQQEAALEGSQLTKLLLANSAHEVRTPLNAIINYLEIALEGVLDTETRDNLTKSYSASKSLIYVINDLLDLTNTEKGQNLIKDEAFDLPQIFKEATAMFEGEAKRKGIKYTVITHPGIPRTVLGDERRVRQAISNLISNAVQYTTDGEVTVELWRAPVTPEPDVVTIQMTVLDTGCGMSDTMLETLFQELEQVSYNDDDTYFFDRDPNDPTEANAEEGEKGVLGLGLALVSRIVRNTHGQLSVRSEQGKGSRFQISLQFMTASDEQPELEPADIPAHTDSPTPFQAKEDFVLVDNSSTTPHEARRRSGDSSRAGSAEKLPNQIPIDSLKDKLAGVSIRELSKLAQTESADDAADSSQFDTKVPASPVTQPFGNPAILQNPEPKTPSGVYSILVAEDDPINSKIIQKRLEKAGHAVHLTVNGEECAAAFRADSARYDLVLMDIQMPIVDGINSTKMIRQLEKESNCLLSPIAQANNRVPIFAVSASLLEKDMPLYVGAGFDGWVMKPINFNRLNLLLSGLEDENARKSATYRPGDWENGGWF